ncbi:response regulator [Derxia lacustris]|uniref:response regulator n=1 Tax=Derxia lacustris TaxID=764842 RepID=UPI000A176550|nr:response regulator transcription factor [Derxia lacustris]
MTIRLVLVDDHPLVREGLTARLRQEPGALPGESAFTVVGEAGSAAEALDCIPRLEPDLVLMDIGMRDMSGIELTGHLIARMPTLKVLMVSVYDRPEFISQALRAGARGYVLKDAPSSEIIVAIRALLAGGVYLPPALGPRMLDRELAATGAEPLSPRERDIMARLARGLSNKQIARELDLSVRTVETHRLNIRRKLNVGAQAELIRLAIERSRPE